MTIQRACAVLATAILALALNGCFVISKNLPAAQPTHDTRIVGNWQAMKGDGNEPDGAFLHFQDIDASGPFRLVWVEGANYQIYEVTTYRIANRNIFAAKIVDSIQKKANNKNEAPQGYFIGVYDVAANSSEITFRMLDAEKVGELIKTGALHGVPPPGKYDFAQLTGSPNEVAQYLAAPNLALVEETSHMRHLPPYTK